mmetsp:Transcript_104981/g.306702  ORF Transcript_104981/g.306702 Transcript_104981/m.306702 type:complete len:100 (-) Transcript_104981:245-544(-)
MAALKLSFVAALVENLPRIAWLAPVCSAVGRVSAHWRQEPCWAALPDPHTQHWVREQGEELRPQLQGQRPEIWQWAAQELLGPPEEQGHSGHCYKHRPL